ncbi:unnamed protein product, partial [Pleuronectes platessa]
MERDEEVLKVPRLKRKTRSNSGSSKAKKGTVKKGGRGAAESESSMETDSFDSESSDFKTGSQNNSRSYSAGKMKVFLQKTKNMKGLKVEDYISEKEQFSNSAQLHMSSKAEELETELAGSIHILSDDKGRLLLYPDCLTMSELAKATYSLVMELQHARAIKAGDVVKKFLQTLLTGDFKCTKPSEKVKQLATSFGSDLVFVVTAGKSFTPESLEVEEVVEGRLLVVRAK